MIKKCRVDDGVFVRRAAGCRSYRSSGLTGPKLFQWSISSVVRLAVESLS